MRIDQFLMLEGKAESRTAAKRLVEDGRVTVNGELVKKPAFEVTEKDEIAIASPTDEVFVSRGAYKLRGALDAFRIDVSGVMALDIGASSGGFTDLLLRRGASSVIALDAGEGQLAAALRADSRVKVIEKYNARNLKSEDLPFLPNFAVMDVSFISVTLILPALYKLLPAGARTVILIKPQFEVGRSHIGKGGIVKDKKAVAEAVARVENSAKDLGFTHHGTVLSPILGGDGNTEYLAYFVKEKEA